MSGHSHWQNIRAKKKAVDAKKGAIFSKLSRLITIAARGGANPSENPKLREVIEKARSFDMPSSNIERAIKRGTGEIGGGRLEEVIFEAYGPGNIAIIIEGITDNKNRFLAEIKQILNRYKGKLAEQGSVNYLFEKKGVIVLDFEDQNEKFKNKEELELAVIDAGAEDISWDDKFLEIYTDVNQLNWTKEGLVKRGVKVESSALGWRAKNEITVSGQTKESLESLFSLLDEHNDVQGVYSNVKA